MRAEMRATPWLALVAVGVLFATTDCSRYKAGDCVQNTRDGFIWRITETSQTSTTVQGWFDGKWGIPVEAPKDLFASHYVKIECPLSTKTVKERH